MIDERPRRGAVSTGDGGARFTLWAPSWGDVEILDAKVLGEHVNHGASLAMRRHDDGEHWVAEGSLDGPVAWYEYAVEARLRSTGRTWRTRVSDPYAREVYRDFRSVLRADATPHRFAPFARPALRDLIVYELHVYNFTAEDPRVRGLVRGTYAGVKEKLPHLLDLGVNAIELMPVFDYSDPWQVGVRWNYNTACHLCAPHRAYAARTEHARQEFIELVEACHDAGVAVIVDAVFQQVSRRFSYARLYDPDHDPRRSPDVTNNPVLGAHPRERDAGGCDLDCDKPAALGFVRDVIDVWFDELGIDGMRFDRVPGELRWRERRATASTLATEAKSHGGDTAYRIAEPARDDGPLDGTDFNAQWLPRFHDAAIEALHHQGLSHLELRMNPRAQGFSDERVPVVFLDNHDDERLANRGGRPWWRLQPPTIALFTHPGVPMIYMGAEYAEDDHTRFENGLPRELNPLDWELTEAAGPLLRLHRAMAFLRRRLAALRGPAFTPLWRHESEHVLVYGRGEPELQCVVALNFDEAPQTVRVPVPGVEGVWHEFLFNLTFHAAEGEMRYVDRDGARWDRLLIPGSYAHVYCREKLWTDAEWTSLFARDRT